MEAEANVEWNYKFLLKYTECQAVMKKDFSCSWIIYFHNFLFAVHLNKRGPPCFCNKAQLHKKKSNFISAIIFCSWLVYFHNFLFVVHKYIYSNKRRPLHSSGVVEVGAHFRTQYLAMWRFSQAFWRKRNFENRTRFHWVMNKANSVVNNKT